jgi:acetoacetate decarboxylase
MGFQLKKNKVYEMPVFFGPVPVPKNLDEDGNYVLKKPGDIEAITVMFETEREQLETLLPEGFSLYAPVLSIAECEFANLGHFGGNTYTLVNISVPVHFKGTEEALDGDLVLAMFENHAEPIIGGRDQLGYSKIYADMTPFIKNGKTIKACCSSWGFRFLELTLTPDKPAENPDRITELGMRSKGKFNYKYIQSTPYKGMAYGSGGSDASYVTFNPKEWTKPKDYPFTIRKPEITFCSGSITFHRPEPDDMPTYWHIVQYLSDLKIKQYLGAQHSFYNDPCDYSHVYRVK